MAKQAGQILLTGSIDNLSFSKSPFGYLAKRKTGPTRKAVLQDKNFARTRENAADFKTAVRAATMIRHSLQPFLRAATNVWLNGRMNGLLLKAVRADTTNRRGKKVVPTGGLTILKKFEINHKNTMAERRGFVYKATMNVKGNMQLSIDPFFPKKTLAPPEDATHFKIVSAGAALDFKKYTTSKNFQLSPLLAINSKKLPPLILKHYINATVGQSLLLAVGIVFYKTMDGKEKMLKGGAMKIVAVREVIKKKK
jgi:hypothetical protein